MFYKNGQNNYDKHFSQALVATYVSIPEVAGLIHDHTDKNVWH